jgi:hypothetical protein
MMALAAAPGEAAPAHVQARWTDLLARLALAAEVSNPLQAHLQLRALSLRCTRTPACAAGPSAGPVQGRAFAPTFTSWISNSLGHSLPVTNSRLPLAS